jgi:hypothetical protein
VLSFAQMTLRSQSARRRNSYIEIEANPLEALRSAASSSPGPHDERASAAAASLTALQSPGAAVSSASGAASSVSPSASTRQHGGVAPSPGAPPPVSPGFENMTNNSELISADAFDVFLKDVKAAL